MLIIEEDKSKKYAHDIHWAWLEVSDVRINVGEINTYADNYYIFMDMEYNVGHTISCSDFGMLLSKVYVYYEALRVSTRKVITIQF